jgi:hypothetical protein
MKKRAKTKSLTSLTINLTTISPPKLPPHNKKLKRDAQRRP